MDNIVLTLTFHVSKRVRVSKGLRVNCLSKCIIIRSYGELWFKAYVLLLEILERVMVSKGLRVYEKT